jgi:5,10-methylenetetrahydrofolate reductase
MATVVERCAQGQEAVLFICDFSPPRGPDPKLLEPAGQLDADFISVAYNPGRSTRVNSAFAAHWIKENTGKDVLFTLATRDMNKVAAQSLLLGASLLGLENVVAVRGDEFTDRDLATVKAVHDFRPTELVSSVNSMNQGLDFKGGKLRSPTSFCVGAAIDLGHETERETRLTRKKVEAGAQFFLLQAIFDPLRLKEFLAGYARRYSEALSIPIFCGIQVMTSDSLVFGDVPKWVTDDLEKGRPGEEIAIQVLDRFVDQGFRSIYLIPPIMRGGRRDYQAAQRVLAAFKG